jgi:hypothetical protein
MRPACGVEASAAVSDCRGRRAGVGAMSAACNSRRHRSRNTCGLQGQNRCLETEREEEIGRRLVGVDFKFKKDAAYAAISATKVGAISRVTSNSCGR